MTPATTSFDLANQPSQTLVRENRPWVGPDTPDVIIVGGGHNGLVCAWYLANAGKSVLILEKRGVLGGAAVTEEFHPGFRNSLASYTVSLLNPKIISDMALSRHGLTIVERRVPNAFLRVGEEPLVLGPGIADTQAQLSRFSRADAAALPDYYATLEAIADVLRTLVLQTPPNVGAGWGQIIALIKQAGKLRHLSPALQAHLIDIFTMSADDFLRGWFEHEAIRAAFAFDGVVGTLASPRDPGTAYVLLHHCFGEVNGKKGAWGHAIGGMGSITAAMAAACAEKDVRWQLNSPVDRLVPGKRPCAVLGCGDRLSARAIAVNAGPKILYDQLMTDVPLPEYVRERMKRYHCHSGSFRMNLALRALPAFTYLAPDSDILTGGLIVAPSIDYMDQAAQDARHHGWSRTPIIEMLIPSTLDPSLAPPGRHVASLFCQHMSYDLPDQQQWDDLRDQVADTVIATLGTYAPNLKDLIVGHQILSPLDLERTLSLDRGDIFHGSLRQNQLYSARPFLGAAAYKTPAAGIFLCGSGAHPGGGVTGAPGHNAARTILSTF